jgi:hypothetical protein
VYFIIDGDGHENNRMCKLVRKYCIERQVHFLGFVIEPQLPLLIMNLHITLNIGEITGIAAMEAAYLGVPVLAIQLCLTIGPKLMIGYGQVTTFLKLLIKPLSCLMIFPKNKLTTEQTDYVKSHCTVESMSHSCDELYLKIIGKRNSVIK